MQDNHGLNWVLFWDECGWAGQCVEYDIGVQSKSLDEIPELIEVTVMTEMRESERLTGQKFGGIGPAPDHFRAQLEACAGAYQPKRPPAMFEEMNVRLALCA